MKAAVPDLERPLGLWNIFQMLLHICTTLPAGSLRIYWRVILQSSG